MVGVCDGECFGLSQGDAPLTLTRFYNCRLSQLYEALEVGVLSMAKPVNVRV